MDALIHIAKTLCQIFPGFTVTAMELYKNTHKNLNLKKKTKNQLTILPDDSQR